MGGLRLESMKRDQAVEETAWKRRPARKNS